MDGRRRIGRSTGHPFAFSVNVTYGWGGGREMFRSNPNLSWQQNLAFNLGGLVAFLVIMGTLKWLGKKLRINDAAAPSEPQKDQEAP